MGGQEGARKEGLRRRVLQRLVRVAGETPLYMCTFMWTLLGSACTMGSFCWPPLRVQVVLSTKASLCLSLFSPAR